MNFIRNWLRQWQSHDNFFCSWAKHIDALFGAKTPPRRPTSLQVESLEERTLPASGMPFFALENQAYNGAIGSFTPAPGTTSADYQVVKVLWGDGTQSAGSIDSSNNITSGHVYTAPGAYAVAFQLLNTTDNTTQVGVAVAFVEDPLDDTKLQVLPNAPSVWQWNGGADQSGADGGGGFNLSLIGYIPCGIASATIEEPHGTISVWSGETYDFTLQESGSDSPGGFSIDSYSISATEACQTISPQLENDP